MVRAEVSDDGGVSWGQARLRDDRHPRGWVRWTFPWTPREAGNLRLLVRAADETGAAQPERAALTGPLFLDRGLSN